MPRKIRQLIKELKKAEFVNRGGKGSHRNFKHKNGPILTISGALNSDVKPYQEKLVKIKIKESKDERKR
ncbi:MAG: type II toxin-antitoxin system HicA family toxin [Candidatus Marinimicrobia bacterium]|jgi:predicted RNA binding protein YcfA (HicA-like mRNA interferase family)|nr:type II toxin-antitoxin system HicA family toxin [Candidatus Neomarinimicrobiota bacterium]MBT3496839.1 type II toxin-antitoxin system HicA family toxin [Candidatus Neomarinimicrobiota bacterium]MBT3692944.1 type II toxin-antitoxin system HicA family toxin [Candidatus Neomarinimicrobiota bacterium]MBT3732079.1 type II toxin-antitoxin system HicA family toxin [Candidatus Neomarinimicrobiota bacterium]MBT4144335.1 type II toxin-antitoxin system HicA family toxin [Candidatus Neomarinimicrobiota